MNMEQAPVLGGKKDTSKESKGKMMLGAMATAAALTMGTYGAHGQEAVQQTQETQERVMSNAEKIDYLKQQANEAGYEVVSIDGKPLGLDTVSQRSMLIFFDKIGEGKNDGGGMMLRVYERGDSFIHSVESVNANTFRIEATYNKLAEFGGGMHKLDYVDYVDAKGVKIEYSRYAIATLNVAGATVDNAGKISINNNEGVSFDSKGARYSTIEWAQNPNNTKNLEVIGCAKGVDEAGRVVIDGKSVQFIKDGEKTTIKQAQLNPEGIMASCR